MDKPTEPGEIDGADATGSQAPQIVDADATRSRAPAVGVAAVSIVLGDTFVDEPESYSVAGRIGVGGMGTVVAATSRRFGRTVALKVVTADREDLRRRFEREAQVTARLQHPAIVPVYGSGHRDGQPFYAMKQVSGEPLDKAIANRTTLEKRIALLPNVIAVTEAIAYAHAERVIHRDLKPANILVGAFGETVVIDWGLAKDLARTEEVAESVSPYRALAADETAHGKVMGTPAYMPIEQARGEPVDERADVYALGAILYHVLAGVPPFARLGEASVPWESMLARVLSGPPTPLETLQPGLPPDLLAIVARALATSPDARYPSAGELADDLRRFQTGQLVGAHHYSAWQLVRRWLKKHRTPVAVAVVAAVLLSVLAIVSVRRIVREQERTEQQRVAAQYSRGEAEGLMGFMLVNLRDKLKPLGKLDLLDDVAKKAVAYYNRKGEELSDPELGKRGLARRNLGDVLLAQGHADGALAEYQAALAIGQTLVSNDATNAEWHASLAISHEKLGEVALAQGHATEALASYRTALAIWQTRVNDPANTDRQRELAGNHGATGNVLRSRGDLVGALAEYRTSFTITASLAAADPTNPVRQRDLAVSRNRLGDVLFAQGDGASALVEYRASLVVGEALVAKDPANAEWQRDLFFVHTRIGGVLQARADTAGAIAAYRASVSIAETLAKRDPTNADRQQDLALGHAQVADMLDAQGDTAVALVQYREALAIFQKLAANDPTNANRLVGVSYLHNRIGDVLHAHGDPTGALAQYRAAVTIAETRAARDPSNAGRQSELATTHSNVGDVLIAQGDFSGALAEFRIQLTINTTLRANDPTNADRQHALAIGHERVGDVLLAQGSHALALAEYQAELALYETVLAKDPTSAKGQGSVAVAQKKVANALLAQGDKIGALAKYRASLAIREALAVKDPTNTTARSSIAYSQMAIGDVLVALNDRAGALAAYEAGKTIVASLAATDATNTNWTTLASQLATKLATCCKGITRPR